MNVTLQLYGAFRDLHNAGRLELELGASASVADLRQAFDQHARQHWPDRYQPGLLAVTAIADAQQILDETARYNRVENMPCFHQ